MLRLAHIKQLIPPRPLLLALHNLNPTHIRAVDLIHHLHAHPCHLIAQMDTRIDALASDIETDTSVGFAALLADQQDVAYACAFRVVFGEEAGAATGGICGGDLHVVDLFDGVFAFGPCCRWRREDGDLLVLLFDLCCSCCLMYQSRYILQCQWTMGILGRVSNGNRGMAVSYVTSVCVDAHLR